MSLPEEVSHSERRLAQLWKKLHTEGSKATFEKSKARHWNQTALGLIPFMPHTIYLLE